MLPVTNIHEVVINFRMQKGAGTTSQRLLALMRLIASEYQMADADSTKAAISTT